ncbi:MAG: hypothetical protein GWN47_11665 [Woeseiaceae bacterium]|nr:hypothetical protein [Woeseiaceae bacterium]
MNRGATTRYAISGTGLALLVVFAAWSLPAHAASGVVVECEESDKITALVHTASQTVAEVTEIKESTDDADKENAAENVANDKEPSPTVTTRLPGVSDSALPGFRRQMLRTDI